MDGGDDGRRGRRELPEEIAEGSVPRDRGGEARAAAVRHGLGRLAPGENLVGGREIAQRSRFIETGTDRRRAPQPVPFAGEDAQPDRHPGDSFQNGTGGRGSPAAREVVLGEKIGEDAPGQIVL